MPALGRQLRSCVGKVRYSMYLGSLDATKLNEVMDLVRDGCLRPVLDPQGPFVLSTNGARAAFDRLQSRRVKGKVVIRISNDVSDVYTS